MPPRSEKVSTLKALALPAAATIASTSVRPVPQQAGSSASPISIRRKLAIFYLSSSKRNTSSPG